MAESNKPFYERGYESVQNWVNGNVSGLFGKATNDAADYIGKDSADKTTVSTVKTAAPYVAAAAVGAAGLLLAPTTEKFGKKIAKGVRQIVTGGGYLEKNSCCWRTIFSRRMGRRQSR